MSRTTLNVLISCALAGIVASPLTAVAMQAGFGEPATRVVNFADLDLSRNAGVAALYLRIKSAAREVCEPVDNWSSRMLNSDCRHEAIARAIADVNSPALTSYYRARGGAVTAAVQQ
jgi:UrcA family protein